MRRWGGAAAARERSIAYLAAFLDGQRLDAAVAEVRRRRRFGRTAGRVLRTAHTVLRDHARVTPEAAAFTLVTVARATPDEAAAIVGLDPARLRLLLSGEGADRAGQRTSWVGRPARRDLLWPGVATVWLAVLALAVLPADGVARGPALLLAQPRADLALSAVSTSQPRIVQPGGRLQVAVVVLNGGPDTAEDVTVRLRATGSVDPVAGSGRLTLAGSDQDATTSFDVGTLLSDTGVTVDAIPAAASAQLEAELAVAGDAADGSEVGLVAQVSVPSFGELESSRATSTVQRRPELAVDLSVSPAATAAPGDRLTWTVQVRNVGTVDAGSVSVHGALPAGLRYVDGSALVDGRAPSAPTDGNGVGLAVGTVGAGAARTASFETVVTPEVAGDVIRYQVRSVHMGADGPARSNTVRVDIAMAGELADTGLRMFPAAVLAAILLTAGAALLARRGEPQA